MCRSHFIVINSKSYFALKRGFTLVEMLMVIVLISTLSLISVDYIKLGLASYFNFKQQNNDYLQAQFIMARLELELRQSIPNSLAISKNNRCLTYTPIDYAGFYLSPKTNDAVIEVAMATDDIDWAHQITSNNYHIVFEPISFLKLHQNSFLVLNANNNYLTLNKKPKVVTNLKEEGKRFYLFRETYDFCFYDSKLIKISTVNGQRAETTIVDGLSNESYFRLKNMRNQTSIDVNFTFNNNKFISHIELLNAS